MSILYKSMLSFSFQNSDSYFYTTGIILTSGKTTIFHNKLIFGSEKIINAM